MLRVTTEISSRKALESWLHPPPYIMNDELRRRGIEARLFVDWPGAAEGTGRVTPAQELSLFKQLHYCGYRLSKIYKAANKKPSVALKRQYASWVQKYNLIRSRLVDGNLGLVYDLIGRTRFNNLERDEMSSEGMMALLRAVDTFDPWRGFRFSTYACNAIIRAFARASMTDSKRRNLIVGTWDPEFEKSDFPEVKRGDQRGLFIERLGRIMRGGDAGLTEVEKTVLARRFPAEDSAPRQTLEDIGRQMKVSKERVRQIQLAAIRKLRQAMDADTILT